MIGNFRFNPQALRQAVGTLLIILGFLVSTLLALAVIALLFWALAQIGAWAVVTAIVVAVLAFLLVVLYFAIDEDIRHENGES